MAAVTTTQSAGSTSGIAAVVLAWLIPGGGYFLLKRPVRGLLVLGCVLIMFLVGIMMRGAFFTPQGEDTLTMLIYYGGFVAHLATGAIYFIAASVYNQPDVAGHVHDYGAKLLVGAGLLNILAIVDVWDIATGKKD